MNDYIEREKVTLGVLGLTIVDPAVAAYAEAVLCQVQNIPHSDVAPVRHGRWEKMDTTGIHAEESVWECSSCGYPVGIWTTGSKYCPNCGAKMDGGVDNG